MNSKRASFQVGYQLGMISEHPVSCHQPQAGSSTSWERPLQLEYLQLASVITWWD